MNRQARFIQGDMAQQQKETHGDSASAMEESQRRCAEQRSQTQRVIVRGSILTELRRSSQSSAQPPVRVGTRLDAGVMGRCCVRFEVQ